MFKDKPKIQNKTAYFNKVVKNMRIKEKIKQRKIEKHEFSSDELRENMGNNFEMASDFDIEKQIESESLLGWIELLENTKLYEAVKSLPIEDQIFISYIIKEKRTLRELAKVYGVTQQALDKKLKKVILKIRKTLKK